MQEPDRQNMVATNPMETLHSLSRLLATLVGIVLIILGSVYAVKLFEAIYASIRNPAQMTGLVDHWTAMVGGEDAIDIKFADTHVKGARVLAIIIVGAAAVLLAWLSLGITLAGARIISWTAGDRQAVKKILKAAFGNHLKGRELSESD